MEGGIQSSSPWELPCGPRGWLSPPPEAGNALHQSPLEVPFPLERLQPTTTLLGPTLSTEDHAMFPALLQHSLDTDWGGFHVHCPLGLFPLQECVAHPPRAGELGA